MEGVLLLLIGLISGAYGILVGAGGGFIFVPALLLIMHLPPHVAAGTGLVIVLVNSLSGVTGFVRQKRIDYKLAWLISLGAFPGSFIGAKLTQYVSSTVFYALFATVLVGLGLFLLVKNRKGQSLPNEIQYDEPLGIGVVTSLLLFGIFMGTLSTFFGLGGGWLMVPVLIYIFKVAPHRATATSIFALCLYSVVGVVIHIYHGNVDWMAAFFGGTGAMIGAQIGVFISKRISGKMIMQLLSILLIVIGVKMLL
ncbi:sulfite exporter TauE/SafE family protein [Virgibacillus soli]